MYELVRFIFYHILFLQRSDGKLDYYILPSNPRIKIIDFGNAIKKEHPRPGLITTRDYRSPEALLGLPWSYETDVWSVGCVLVELFLGIARTMFKFFIC